MKKLILILGVISAAFAANASFLYWQVSEGAYTETYNSARLIFANDYIENWGEYSATKNSGVITADGIYHEYSSSKETVKVAPDVAYVADIGGLTSGSSYSYWVELYNNDTRVALSQIGHINNYVSESATDYVYADATGLTTSLSEVAAVAVWHSGGYTAVPEPTSAVLMLFGAAFLGLKRKNRSIA